MVEDMYVERLAECLELTSATVSFHLKKLEDAGTVKSYKDQYYTMYSINKDFFEVNIIDILSEKTSESELQKERDDAYRKKVIDDRKLDALEDLIEAACGKPVLVAYWYKHDKDRIQKRFDCRSIESEKDIEDWDTGKVPVALIHPASAGHGLNLQEGGSHLIWFSVNFSLELTNQCNCRLYRQGQKNTVTVQHILTRETIDEDIVKALEKKDCTQEAILAAVKARL